MKRIPFLLIIGYLLSTTFLFAQDEFYNSERFDVDEAFAPFYHGVASGDPTSNSIMLWTRVSTDSMSAHVEWQVATDTAMTDIVISGSAMTDGESDFTVKVDVQGLQPYTTYYYEFRSQGKNSIRGRTKTAPSIDDEVNSLRFGVVSCSNFAFGYFHVYDKLVDRNDIDAVIHLGDFIYEYGDGEYGDVRELEPSEEILTLSDYRMRHSYYKLDPQLRRMMQQYPLIATWDDHESANDAWMGGADNHNPDEEGDWFERKSNAIQAYHEWMPFRKPDATDEERIYRKLQYGDLMDLYMLDTRLIGREEQDGANNTTAGRTLLGENQKNWIKDELTNSTAKWQVIGQQVMMAPLQFFGNGFNADQWDGYRAERDELQNWIISEDVPNLVVLTGDIHTSWANDLPLDGYDEDTGANSAGVEFVVTSVTSPGLPLPGGENIALAFNSHMKWANLTNRGYYILDLNEQRCQADWFFVESVTDESTSDSHASSWYTDDGTRHLQGADEPAIPDPSIFTTLAPDAPRPSFGVSVDDLNELAFIGVHPNPASNQIYLQFFNHESLDMNLVVYDVTGRELMQVDLGKRAAGLQNKTIDISDLEAGTYFVVLKTEKGSYRKTVVKS